VVWHYAKEDPLAAWGRRPLRFFVVGNAAGILFGYVLFRIVLGVPEMIAGGLGVLTLLPLVILWEIRWRLKSGHRILDGQVASIYGIPTWIATPALLALWMAVLLIRERT
jgi:hypothetical protein